MDRLGLGWDAVRAINPRIVYCSITGYAPDGPSSNVAGHDLTYMADAGILSLANGGDGQPALPPVLVGDIGGGTMPAVINILLALLQRQQTGEGARIQVSITDNLLAWPYSAIPRGKALGSWPVSGGERLTGGSPRYQIYRTKDGRHLAAAPLEERFWRVFCDCIGLAEALRPASADPAVSRAAVAEIIASRDSTHWRQAFAGKDACATVVRTMEEAAAQPEFARYFDRQVDGVPMVASVISPAFRASTLPSAPGLGEANRELLAPDLSSRT
jgi:crotonobetainyl-CoA:carnitine CoA-transferase CaiB-like acyl-CoA transferase